MNNIHKVLIISPILMFGCQKSKITNRDISPKFDSLNMNIYSTKGEKIYSIFSPQSSFDRGTQVFNLKETTIELFKDNEAEYKIKSNKSTLSNLKKTINLNGDVLVKNIIKNDSTLNADNFFWNYKHSDYLLTGNVRFEDDKIILNSNKAIFDKNTEVIEFFNPVRYIIKNDSNETKYEINSENAFYNINTKSISFTSSEKRVRSKFYF